MFSGSGDNFRGSLYDLRLYREENEMIEIVIDMMIMMYFALTLFFGWVFHWRLQETEKNLIKAVALYRLAGERLDELEKPKTNVVQMKRFR